MSDERFGRELNRINEAIHRVNPDSPDRVEGEWFFDDGVGVEFFATHEQARCYALECALGDVLRAVEKLCVEYETKSVGNAELDGIGAHIAGRFRLALGKPVGGSDTPPESEGQRATEQE